MRICMVASTYPRFDQDGAGRFNRSLAEALVALGHEVHVLIPQDPAIQPYPTPVHIHVFRYVWPSRFATMGYAKAMESDRRLKGQAYLLIVPFLISGGLALWRLVKSCGCDLIHTHWVLPNGPMGLFVSRMMRIPLVVSLHGSDVFFARRNPLFTAVARQILQYAQGVTVCSPDLYEGALALGASPDAIHMIPWGADPLFFAHPKNLNGLRDRLGLTEGESVILALGRLVGKKGFDVLIHAMPHILCCHPQARCVIIGDGPEASRLQALADTLGVSEQVLFPGSIPWNQVPAYLHLGDVFVAPSVHDAGNLDGLPTVVLEAMAAGRPVVASNVAGLPLVVSHGETGLLVPERDPIALAEAVSYLLQYPEVRQRFGEAGRQRVLRELNWETVARRFLTLYHSAYQRGVP